MARGVWHIVAEKSKANETRDRQLTLTLRNEFIFKLAGSHMCAIRITEILGTMYFDVMATNVGMHYIT